MLGPATELEKSIATVSVLAIALAAIISVALSRSITRPVAALEEVTRNMAKGRLDQRIRVRRDDELGRLGDSFNKMASELESMYTDLDAKVQQRTAELENANKKLSVLSSITRHDSLNLVTVQKGWLDMAKEASDNPRMADFVNRLPSSVAISARCTPKRRWARLTEIWMCWSHWRQASATI